MVSRKKLRVRNNIYFLWSKALGTPVNNIEPINPQFDAARDVRFLLQTRQNRLSPQTILFRNLQTLQQSHFDRTKPLRVLIHGWFGDDTTDLNTFTSAELLNYYDFNVILLDWGEGAQTINYAAAVLRVPRVGEVLAQQLDFLHQNGFISWDRVAIVGFSLGGLIKILLLKFVNFIHLQRQLTLLVLLERMLLEEELEKSSDLIQLALSTV